MIVRMNGQFGAFAQGAVREAFRHIVSPVTIDLQEAALGSAALGEILLLANRIGIENVTLANPGPMMRKLLQVTQFDRVLRVTPVGHIPEWCQRSA